jgi:hypothetical protein
MEILCIIKRFRNNILYEHAIKKQA